MDLWTSLAVAYGAVLPLSVLALTYATAKATLAWLADEGSE